MKTREQLIERIEELADQLADSNFLTAPNIKVALDSYQELLAEQQGCDCSCNQGVVESDITPNASDLLVLSAVLHGRCEELKYEKTLDRLKRSLLSLQNRGLIASQRDDTDALYSVTDAGREVLERSTTGAR